MPVSSYLPKILLYGVLALLIVSNVSCVLEKEDSNFLDVPKISDSQYIADWVYSYDGGQFYPVSDTLWLAGSERLQMKPSGGEVYGYEIRIDGQLITSAQSAETYTLTTQNLKAGYHRVAVTEFVKSGTGSLADKLNGEYVSYTGEFTLVVGTVNFKPHIESFSKQNGTLQLKWKQYPYADFQTYEIRKYESYGLYQSHRKLTITSRDQVTFDDTTYVGGFAVYVLAVNRGGKYFESKQYMVRYENNDRLQLMPTTDGKLELSWHLPPFYRNVSYVSIRKGSEVVVDKIPAEQTSFTIEEAPSIYGKLSSYSVSFTAKVEDPRFQFDRLHISDNLTIGKRTPPYNTLVYNATDKMYYLVYSKEYYDVHPDGFYKLNQELEIVDSVRYSSFSDKYNLAMITSPDGALLYLADNGMLKKIDKNTLKVSEAFHATGNFNSGTLRDNFSVSNTDRIVYIDGTNVVVFDYKSKQIMLKVPLQKSAHISSDGMYIVNGSSLYHFDGENFVIHETLPYTNIRYVRFLEGGKKLFTATDSRAVVYDYATKEEVIGYSFTTPEGVYAHLEQSTMNFAVKINGTMALLDINSGTNKAIPVYGEIYYRYNYLMAGDYVLTNNGGFGLRYINE